MRRQDRDLARAALVASGVRRDEVSVYLDKLGRLFDEVAFLRERSERERAAALFDWLWQSKPHRYRRGGPFRLSHVVDAQLGGAEVVGNCLGLTLLYNVVAQALGLRVTAVHVEDAFGTGPHVLSLLHTAAGTIDVEHALRDGFGYAGHLDSPQREEWSDRQLVADVYHSAANECFERGDLESALGGYNAALRLNPGYAKARLNKGMVLVELGESAEARRWLG